MPITKEKRTGSDFSNLRLDGKELPAVYVRSSFERKSGNPAFLHLLRALENQPQPGLFFTPNETGDKMLRVRLRLNRHGILSSEIFRDQQGRIYRDVDVKGIGYIHCYPMRVLPVQDPHMENDEEERGILHHDFAQDDWLITEELTKHNIRVAGNVALIELFELVDRVGSGEAAIVPRDQVGKGCGWILTKLGRWPMSGLWEPQQEFWIFLITESMRHTCPTLKRSLMMQLAWFHLN